MNCFDSVIRLHTVSKQFLNIFPTILTFLKLVHLLKNDDGINEHTNSAQISNKQAL